MHADETGSVALREFDESPQVWGKYSLEPLTQALAPTPSLTLTYN